MNYILTFLSTHHAIKAEKRLQISNFDLELIPTPREISSECGFTILVKNTNAQSLLIFLEEDDLQFEKIYKFIELDGEKKYEEIN